MTGYRRIICLLAALAGAPHAIARDLYVGQVAPLTGPASSIGILANSSTAPEVLVKTAGAQYARGQRIDMRPTSFTKTGIFSQSPLTCRVATVIHCG